MSGDFRDRAQHIQRLALSDAETGLPNRLGVEQQLIDALARKDGVLAVCALSVQDGPAAFDAAAHLSDGKTIVGRLGATSLALAFVVADPGAAQATLAEILGRQSRPFKAGLVVASGAANVAYDLLNAAEYALERAHAEDAQILFVDAGALRDGAAEAALLADLGASFAAGEMSLNYQPKVRLSDGAVAGVESLARWTHPRRGMVSPDVFVPIAEASGQIGPLTEWALARAADDQRALAANGFDLPFSVNISAALLSNRAFAARAIEMVRTTGARLCFEITETAVMTEPLLALQIVADFAAAGIEISIDDYGARLSSLSYLMKIPAQELKIDKKFIGMLATSAYDRTLVGSMIDLAHDLGLTVTAEGVEDAEALEALRQMRCDCVQGNLLAPPMALAQLQDYLARP